MCAIAGLLACAERLQYIRRMTGLMGRRGPDDEASGKAYDPAIWRIICLGGWMRLFNVTV